MRSFELLGPVWLRDVGTTVIERLQSVAPDGFRGRGQFFHVRLPQEDPRLTQIREVLAAGGLTTRLDRSRGSTPGRECSVEIQRYYDDADLRSAPLLELGFTPEHPPMKCEYRNDRGKLVLKRYPNRHITYAISSCFTVITNDVRQAMEAEGLADDAVFLPTERMERPQLPVWELHSRRTFPPVAPSMMLFESDWRTPFQGDYERVCVRQEGLYLQAELHYRAADIAAMASFDLAHTKERFGESPSDEYRPLVVSARFYDMCRRHRFNGGFTPVRIDS